MQNVHLQLCHWADTLIQRSLHMGHKSDDYRPKKFNIKHYSYVKTKLIIAGVDKLAILSSGADGCVLPVCVFCLSGWSVL